MKKPSYISKGTSKNSFWRAKCAAMKWRNRSVAALREDCAEASLQASLPLEWIFRGFRKRFYHIILCTAAISLPLSACITREETRGHLPVEEHLAEITTGKSTRDEVLQKLGTPSTQSNFGDEAWYYISTNKESIAFLKPEITQQKVTRILFDDKGVVAKIDNYDQKDSQDIKFAKKITPTEGHSLGFFEQILGNIGKFNKSDTGVAHSASRGGIGGPGK